MPRTNSAVLGFSSTRGRSAPQSFLPLFFGAGFFGSSGCSSTPSAISLRRICPVRVWASSCGSSSKVSPLAGSSCTGATLGAGFFAARRQGCVQFMQERLGAFRYGLVPQLHGKTGGRLRGRRGLRLHRIVWGHDRLAHGFRFAAGGRPSERHGAFPLLAGGELHGIPLFILR